MVSLMVVNKLLVLTRDRFIHLSVELHFDPFGTSNYTISLKESRGMKTSQHFHFLP